MKRVAYFLFLASSLFLSSLNFMTAQTIKTKIGVISDLHYTHPSLIVEKGAALENYLSNDRKLLVESEAILKEAVANLLAENVNIVLIPGDLTKDGEKVSHRGVAHLLKPLREKGIKILVIPGNHDINNPEAVRFHGDSTQQVETISDEEFAEIYTDYGYGNTISRDKHSLSYVSEPVDGLRILCLDACKYDQNTFVSLGDSHDECITGGALKPETVEWLRTEMQVARILGKQVLGMIHHNVIEHFAYQSVFATPYLVDDFTKVQQYFMEYGLNIIFTGHFHSSDIARVSNPYGQSLHEIETGSIVTYPCPYRIIDINGENMAIETKYIEHIDYPLPEGMDFQTYAAQQIERGFNEMLRGFIHEYYPTFHAYVPRWARSFVTIPHAEELTDIVMSHLSPSALNMLLAHYRGNENLLDRTSINKQELLQNLDDLIDDLAEATTGKMSALTKSVVHKLPIIKKVKASAISIWENVATPESVAANEYTGGKSQEQLAINDLKLQLRFSVPSEYESHYTHIHIQSKRQEHYAPQLSENKKN